MARFHSEQFRQLIITYLISFSTIHHCLVFFPFQLQLIPQHQLFSINIQPHNLGQNSAWRYAQDRGRWQHLVETATLQ